MYIEKKKTVVLINCEYLKNEVLRLSGEVFVVLMSLACDEMIHGEVFHGAVFQLSF